jgi:hypothetical protein
MYHVAMEGETPAPVEQNILGRFEEIQKRFETDPEFSRRSMLKGLGAFIGMTVSQGVVALDILNDRHEQLLTDANGICGTDGLDAVCIARTEGLNVGLEQAAGTTTTELYTTTVAPETTLPPTTLPPTTTTAAPPPPETVPPPPEIKELPEPPPRNMPYETYIKNADLFLSKLPTLEQNHAMFPSSALLNHVPEQLAYIDELDTAIKLSAKEYQAFSIDQSYNQAFGKRIQIIPRLFIWHWAVGEYSDPQDLANKMIAGKSSVPLYADKNDRVYQMIPELFSLTGHARKHLNNFAIGMEVYTGEWGDKRSCLFGYTPARVKNGIYAAVHTLSNAKLPINEKTLLGHYAADLIFDNPYYDPHTGTFHEIAGAKPISLRKTDPPQEFMNMIVTKAKTLAAELGLAV